MLAAGFRRTTLGKIFDLAEGDSCELALNIWRADAIRMYAYLKQPLLYEFYSEKQEKLRQPFMSLPTLSSPIPTSFLAIPAPPAPLIPESLLAHPSPPPSTASTASSFETYIHTREKSPSEASTTASNIEKTSTAPYCISPYTTSFIQASLSAPAAFSPDAASFSQHSQPQNTRNRPMQQHCCFHHHLLQHRDKMSINMKA
ncbi:MAG: hypothetical protein Q9218_002681 [Villophora microphyllina]